MTPIKPTAQQLIDLKTTHGDIFTFEVDEHVVVFKRPERAEYKRMQKRLEKGETTGALEDIGKHSLVFPNEAQIEQLLDGPLPGLLEVVGGEVVKVARGQDTGAKKYVRPSSPA